MKCVNCKNCVGTINEGSIYYICYLGQQFDLIEECIANNEECGCEGYVEDSDDDFTA